MSLETADVRISSSWERPDRKWLSAFAAFPVANIGDAMERLSMCDAGIVPVSSNTDFVGFAFPVLVTAGDNAAVILSLDHIQPGDVMMINGLGHTDRALVGEQLTQRFQHAGAVAQVIDGAVRDRKVIESTGLPTFCRGTTPAGPYKNGPGVIGEPVAIGGVVCSAGDIVVGDADGIIVIPFWRAEAVLVAVQEVARREAAMTAEVTQNYR
ncbi:MULTISPECIES: RraA family protein [Erwinia]|uniref:Putative 4-hydroxy-4-methyl-2-oxoglutarate aldolase n=1 Tax=Erwinia rhapontici TaxID=55212 RepID=A0ABN6DK39_ERWRD|nr:MULTISPECIES: RraA family protein [Erwinia]MBP2155800.1 regulator of RNase E activity RraA [Erwinia rhapontici]MCS3606080.1 regulator of RNase E activity RraA [Erwinia rhapontici]NNS05787.1 RraA family protein [Erwinia sp. JH02]TDS92854.1 regulator of RNase E activity RraA [Erwinia rhapontici]BCQ34947.1 methyltransferase [Erwinia rhapontici]